MSVRGIRAAGVNVPEHELEWRFSRSSGPGGQSVNTTDSRVELLFDLAGSPSVPEHLRSRALARMGHRLVDGRVSVTSSEYRSQHRNRESAKARLVELLEKAFAPPAPKRRPTKPSRGSKERRLAGKKRRSETKSLRRRPDLT
ncbi:MAG TPA: alternative ribosome rescue aminoacyl-tRNA hydrolase ArfB [Nocardioidaceae bacterium]|nr:alternative ribosome rescue aminoacyl-tRNA hydrolase ArfB [Nocardioidaceae bacterium]